LTNKIALYPFKFSPILKKKVWGGNRLSTFLGIEQESNLGESWELSGVRGNISIVANGPLKGKSLNWLIENYTARLMGDSVYSHFKTKFPLLFKFIDAHQDLSVQLHPGDLLARERHDSFGKTEMWYILETEEEARLILGFDRKMDETSYLKYLTENRLPEILHSEKVAPGDSFFIAPGTVHAIGGGILLAEIQQTSDITYRIYDWDRPDLDGRLRELHTEKALEAIEYNPDNPRLGYIDKPNEPVPICTTEYFVTNKLSVTAPVTRNFTDIDSFAVYMCIDGNCTIRWENGSENIKKGETVLIPNELSYIKFEGGKATFLEVYIPH